MNLFSFRLLTLNVPFQIDKCTPGWDPLTHVN